MSSMNWTLASMTQMSAPWMSRIWLVVNSISPQKIEACCAISSAANVTPRMMPKNLARLPVSIFNATQPMASVSLVLLVEHDSFECRPTSTR